VQMRTMYMVLGLSARQIGVGLKSWSWLES
jgi:hypothetical protein